MLNVDYPAAELYGLAVGFLFKGRNERRHEHTACRGLSHPSFMKLLILPWRIAPVHHDLALEWVSEMKQVAICHKLLSTYINVLDSLKESGMIPAYGQSVGIFADVSEDGVKASAGIYNLVGEIFLKDFFFI